MLWPRLEAIQGTPHLPRRLRREAVSLGLGTTNLPKMGWAGVPRGCTVEQAQVLVFRQEMPRLVWKTPGAVPDSGDSASETRAPRPRRVCAPPRCLWFCSSLSANSLG